MDKKSLNERLISIQSELKAPKDKFNTFGGYTYRSAEGIMEAVKPLLAKYGVSLVVSDEINLIGNRFYVKATAMLSSDGEHISVSAFAREADTKKGVDDAQLTGATSSYARKYALNGLFCIDDNKDADTEEYHNQQQNAPKPQARQQPNPQPQAQAVDNETLQIALSEVRAAQSRQSLEEIFPRYAMLQQDNTFRNEYRKRMNELKQQGLWN